MDASVYLQAIRDNAVALADAADRAGLDAPVPSCPQWDVAELVAHIGRVHRWAAESSQRPADAEFTGWSSGVAFPEPSARIAWFREGAVALVEALDRPADTPALTFGEPHTVAFWHRRQAHETAMHRVDAELAAGAATPIDAELASDGIDEWLTLLPQLPWITESITGSGETIHLHCTDVEGEWLVRIAPTGLEVERVHAKGDVAARGGASDLLCWLHGRLPRSHLEVHGDAELLDRFRDVAKF